MDYDERVGPTNTAVRMAFIFAILAITVGAIISSC